MNELSSKTIKPEWRLAHGVFFVRLPHTAPPVSRDRLTAAMVRNEPNAHVRLYWRRQALKIGLTPTQYVKLEAKAQGINYDILTSRSHPMVYYRQRKTVLLKTMRRFRKLSTPQLGFLFHRHHTSILYTLGRTGTAKRKAARV